MQDNTSDVFGAVLHIFISDLSTSINLAHQKELICDFSLILGANLGHRQNFEGKFLISPISRDWLVYIISI